MVESVLSDRATVIIQEWAPLLGLTLPNWRIFLDLDEKEDEATAFVETEYNTIHISLNPAKISDNCDLEELIVHELCHAFTWWLWDAADRMILRYKAPEEHGDQRYWLKNIHELAVTRIAYSLVNLRRSAAP